MSSIKFVTEKDLQIVLQKLFDWMPFKKTSSNGVVINNGIADEDTIIAVGINEGQDNALEIKSDGKIYIKDKEGTNDILLQDIIGATEIDPPGSIETDKIDDIINQYN